MLLRAARQCTGTLGRGSQRGFVRLSQPRLKPYLEEYLLNPLWYTALLPASYWVWAAAYGFSIVAGYHVFMMNYNFYFYGRLMVRTHQGCRLTEDSW